MSNRINFTPGLASQPLSFNANGNDCIFTGEISELKITMPYLGSKMHVVNTTNGNTIIFECNKIDRDGSGEDVYGWRFKALSGHFYPCELLIIND